MIDVSTLVQEVIDGNTDAVIGMGILKELKKQVEKGITAIEADAFAAADKYGAKTFEHGGYEVTLRDGSKRFNFKPVQEWSKAKQSITEIEAKYRAAWALADKGTKPVDAETGEVLDLPEVTYTKASISVIPI